MAQTRLRSAPPPAAASEEASLAPFPPSASLTELRQAMTSPGLIQAEVDALLAAIARPPGDTESPRERADYLLSLLSLPDEASERRGTNGRSLRASALEALMELGYPYALEVPPEVLEAVRLEEPGGAREGGASMPAIVFTVVTLLVQLVMLFLFSWGDRTSHSHDSGMDTLSMISLGLVVLPPLAALFGHLLDWRRLQSMGVSGMVLQGAFWFLYALGQRVGVWVMLVVPWYLPLLSAYLMRQRSEPDDTAPSAPVAPS
ncbi:hypothetical protein [Pyxidicoccus xibeiensis]|uniref:hypothetical protein n=1 Tax=Pyxidicoccus xibeiensis TaxID=2906759 RepID=UPI0020A827CF|nr:hypothetical protein [Pyxidicoccus xibeiensis]MCP3137257.1 hypothetical protein [Pyxidicoccus xibeiensis]